MSNLALKLSSNQFCLVGEDLIVSNLGLINSVVSKFVKKDIQDSELYSVACIAIIEATKTFDPSRSKFSTWATRRMTQAILDQLRKNKKNLSRTVISELDQIEQNKALAVDSCESIPVNLVGSIGTNNDSVDKKMLLLHYLEEKSLSQIAKEFGFTKEGVRKKIKKAIIEIRNKNKDLLKDYIV